MKNVNVRHLLLAAVALLGVPAAAQDRVDAAVDAIPATRTIDQVAMSPDGTHVAYVVEGGLYVAAVSGGDGTAVSVPATPVREITWSADSQELAGISDLPGSAPAAEVWTIAVDGSGAEKLGQLNGYVQTPRFSPDGKTLAVLFTADMPRIAGPLQPMTPLGGVLGQTIFEQRITTFDLSTRAMKQVSAADVYVYEYDWLPDSRGWAAIAAHGSGDNNWWIARLYRVDAANGAMHEIYNPKWQIADPHVAPDGKSVAFIEGLMSDEGLTGGEVEVAPIEGGTVRNLTPGIKASPAAIAWTGADRLGVAGNVDGNSGIMFLGARGLPAGSTWNGWTGEELIGTSTDPWVPAAAFFRDGTTVAAVRQSAGMAPEVWAGAPGQWKQITHLNGTVKRSWGESRNIHWMNGDTRVQGWLMLPANYDPSKKYPLIVSVHGGPSWACTSKWPRNEMGATGGASVLGWFVLCPNPRGSYGQGESFTQGNVKDFGGGDYRDIMAGVDAVAKEYPIDPERIGLRGHSYGGYMTMWAETQTGRFAAAVAGAGLSDWLSYYGLNDIDEWMIPFFGASVYDDPQVYRKSDPIQFVKQVKTPTLILVGDSDGEVPMEQSLEWYHALQTFHVKSEMVVYPGEGHVFYKPADARDYTVRMLRWFDQEFQRPRQ